MLKNERNDETFFLPDITHLLYNVVRDGFKSMVSSLEKLYSGLYPDDATL